MKSKLIIILFFNMFIAVVFAGGYETLIKDIPLKDEESVVVNMDLALADLSIMSGNSKYILKANVSYNPELIDPIIEYNEGKIGILNIECEKRGRFNLEHIDTNENKWELAFTDKVPLEIDLELGLGEGDLDLTGLQISDMSIDAGLSEINLVFDKPNKQRIDRLKIESGLGEFVAKGLLNANFERFQFSGGLGSSELHFTGKMNLPGDAEIEVGLGTIEVYLQKGLPVKIYTQKSFLSSVDLEDFRRVRDGVYISRNWDENAQNRLELDLQVGLGSISVEWED